MRARNNSVRSKVDPSILGRSTPSRFLDLLLLFGAEVKATNSFEGLSDFGVVLDLDVPKAHLPLAYLNVLLQGILGCVA